MGKRHPSQGDHESEIAYEILRNRVKPVRYFTAAMQQKLNAWSQS